MDNVTLEKLKKTHPDNAGDVFKKVAQMGGFGDVDASYAGGLDVSGLPEATQAKIAEYLEKQKPEPAKPADNKPADTADKTTKKEGK